VLNTNSTTSSSTAAMRRSRSQTITRLQIGAPQSDTCMTRSTGAGRSSRRFRG